MHFSCKAALKKTTVPVNVVISIYFWKLIFFRPQLSKLEGKSGKAILYPISLSYNIWYKQHLKEQTQNTSWKQQCYFQLYLLLLYNLYNPTRRANYKCQEYQLIILQLGKRTLTTLSNCIFLDCFQSSVHVPLSQHQIKSYILVEIVALLQL